MIGYFSINLFVTSARASWASDIRRACFSASTAFSSWETSQNSHFERMHLAGWFRCIQFTICRKGIMNVLIAK